MTVEPQSWRIVSDACLPPHMGHVCPEGSYKCEDCSAELREEWLVPDTRLHPIADAWNDIDRDKPSMEAIVKRSIEKTLPELAALLDALDEKAD